MRSTFAAKLRKLLAEVPDDYCRKEINRTLSALYANRVASKAARYQKIISSILSGAREVDEIAEDCGFPKQDTLQLLDELIAQEKVIRRERGGFLNRG
jgi:predicted Rossmann fold nucleotide-binding protein DprA/Smf involved in DNA uptake